MKKIVYQFFTALRMYFKAFPFVQKHRLWPWIGALAGASLLGVLLLLFAAWGFAGEFVEWVSDRFASDQKNGWIAAAQWFLEVLAYILVLILFVRLYKLLVINLMAPLLYFLADKVLGILYADFQSSPFELKRFMRDLIYGVYYAIKVFLLETFLILCISLIALFVPLLAPFATLIVVAVESYFIGLSMIDYATGFKELSIPDAKQFRKEHRAFAFGNGLGFYLIFLIPIVGMLLAPGIAVVAASLGIFHLEENSTAQ